MMAEPPALPCRDDVVVESGDAAPKSCLPSLERHLPTAAGGLVPTGEIPTATKTTYNKTPLRVYAIEETNPNKKKLRTSISSASYDSSFWRLFAVPFCLRVIETNQCKIGPSIQAVLKVVSAPARYWDRGARCFVVRLCVLEQLDKTAAVFGWPMIREQKSSGERYGQNMYAVRKAISSLAL